MFRNNLTGLSEDGKKKFDQVCIHLNGVMRDMGIKFLDGEEDQILIDLWMDTFDYKDDPTGLFGEWCEIGGVRRCIAIKTIREKISVTEPVYDGLEMKDKTVIDEATGKKVTIQVEVPKLVGGRNVVKYVEKRVREIDFSRSLIEKTSVGIYKWRGEQLLLNKIKYLFGDTRPRLKDKDGKPMTRVDVDAWGNERVRAVYGEADPSKTSKRDLGMKINECDLVRPDGEAMTLDDIGISDGSAQGDFEHALLMCALRGELSDIEMRLVERLLDGESVNQIYKASDKKFLETGNVLDKVTTKMINTLKVKVAKALGREDLLAGAMA